MGENNSTSEYVTKSGFDRLDARLSADIKHNTESIKHNTMAITKLEALYNTLIKLPDTILSLEKTVVSVNHNLEAMNSRINQMNESIAEQKHSISALRAENQKQNEDISKVDNKSKIDWSQAITQNFWKLVLVVAGIIVAYKQLAG